MAAGAPLGVERLAARGLGVRKDAILHGARGLGIWLGRLATRPPTPLCTGLGAKRWRRDEQRDERQRGQCCQKDASSV